MSRQSNSSLQGLSLQVRIKEWLELFKLSVQGLRTKDDFNWLWKDLGEYKDQLAAHSKVDLQDAKVLEIGFGARPYRLLALISLGIDALGVDLDAPVLFGSPAEFLHILRRNGLERFIKSLVRFYGFDWKHRADLAKALSLEKGVSFKIDSNRFLVGDVTSAEINEKIALRSLDLIFSEDVFEHIPAEKFPALVANMARWLKPSGLALVRPNVFTGITGGHLVEWYSHTISEARDRASEPWEHLRKKRFRANTFLNKLSRGDYRSLFSKHFEVIEEKVTTADLGRMFLTPEVRVDLASFSEDELFSNQVLFVLTPKP